MPDQDALPRLADALLDVGTRLNQISVELRTLRVAAPEPASAEPAVTELADTGPVTPEPVAPEPAAHEPAAREATPEPLPVPEYAAASTAEPARPWVLPQVKASDPVPYYPPPLPVQPPAPGLWERLSRDGAGSRLLAWAGGVVTLAGVVLLLVLAIQRGWLGPGPRVLLGVGLGVALAGIGMWLHRNPTARTGAYAVGATGVAVLFLDVVAATSLYGFLPTWGGLLAGLAVTAGGVALAGRWQSELFAVFVVVCCAVSAPIITGGFDALLLGFLLVLLVGTAPVQLARHWGGLALAAGLPPVIVCVTNTLLLVDGRIGDDPVLTAILCGATSALLVLLATVTTLRRPEDNFAFATLLLAPAPGMLAAVLLPRVGAAVLPSVVAAVLCAVWAVGRPGVLTPALPRRFALAAGGLASLALLQATATAFDGDARAIALLAESLVLTVLAVRLRLTSALIPATGFGIIGLGLAVAAAANPALVVNPPRFYWTVGDSVALGLTGLALAAAAMTLCWALFRLDVLSDGESAPHAWVPAGLIALYGSTAALLSVGLLISSDRTGFLLGHVLVTVAWTVGAFVLLLRGVAAVPPRVAGLSLVAAALAKLVLFDLSSLDGMARVAAFLVAGLVLLAAGARYARLVAGGTRS